MPETYKATLSDGRIVHVTTDGGPPSEADVLASLSKSGSTGLLTKGNIDLAKQPKVTNPDGSISTVDSSSYNIDGKEVLLPSVTPDGRHLTSKQDIINEYKKTGRHLGIFADADSATQYARQLHEDYAAGKYETKPAGWASRYPNVAAGTRMALDTLPVAGALAGGVIAAPETLGAGSIMGAGLGAGIGRGARDLLAEALGVDQPTSPESKAARIALDTGETAALQALIPGLKEVIKTPGATVKEVWSQLAENSRIPAWVRNALKPPAGLENAPAKALLSRPAWQIWEQAEQAAAAAAPKEVPPMPTTATIRTGTSWTPGRMPIATPGAAGAPTGPLSPQPGPTRPPIQVVPPVEPAPVAAPPAEAAARVVTPIAKFNPSEAMTTVRQTFSALKETPQKGEVTNAMEFLRRGFSAEESVAKVLAKRPAPVKSAVERLAEKLKTPTDAEVESTVRARNASGKWDDD